MSEVETTPAAEPIAAAPSSYVPPIEVSEGRIQIQIPVEELRKRKLFIALPQYGGMCSSMFARSLADLSGICAAHGIPINVFMLMNESLIPRARNYTVDEFMRSDCTHFLFIDADIHFEAQDILAMLALMSEDSPYDILSGVYPKKTIAWEKIKMAVDKGHADQDPNNLENFVGDYVVNFKPGTQQISLSAPAEVLEAGTGFMMIKRDTFIKFQAAYPQYMYKPDHVRSVNFDGSREIMMFFQSEIDPESRRYLSEDYWFCQKANKIGLRNWICPWIKLKHIGTYTFGGSLAALASLGANPTADPSQLKVK